MVLIFVRLSSWNCHPERSSWFRERGPATKSKDPFHLSQRRHLISKSNPQTQTDHAPQSHPPKSRSPHPASAPHTRKNETPHALRTDQLLRADPPTKPHRTPAPQTTGQAFPYQRKSTSSAFRKQSSLAPKLSSAAPTREKSARAWFPAFVSPDKRAHLPETNLQTPLLQSPRSLPPRSSAPSAIHTARSNMARA